MQFIYYVGGESRAKKLVAVGFGLSSDPAATVVDLQVAMPFDLRMMAIEQGNAEKLEQLKDRFKTSHMNGLWYKPSAELQEHIQGVTVVDPEVGKTVRVSLDLVCEEFASLEQLVGEMGLKSKAQLLRKAFRFYQAMYRYKAQGYGIQAVKGGKLIQFPDLDTAR